MLKKEKYISQLNFVKERKDDYLAELSNIISKNFENIELIGCGATLSQMYYLQYILDQYVKIPSRITNSGEAYIRQSKSIKENTLVVVSSHSGSTTESVKAAKMAKDKKATVIAITSNSESKLANSVDYSLIYPSSGLAPSESKLLLLSLIGFVVLQKEGVDTSELEADWLKLPDIFWQTRLRAKNEADKFTSKFDINKVSYILGSGPAYGAAYAFSICKFLEMQWIDSSSLQSGEFFHGPLEKVDENANYILLKTEDKTRVLSNRVENFLKKYSNNYFVIDTKEYDMSINNTSKEIYSALLMWPIMNSLMEEFAQITGHDLDIRRYMGKVDY